MQTGYGILAEVEVRDTKVGDFLDAGSRVVEEQQQWSVPQCEASRAGEVPQQRLDFVAFEEVGLGGCGSFHGDGVHLLTDAEHLGLPRGDVVEQRMQHGQALAHQEVIIKASKDAQLLLLQVQELDSAVLQLAHRRHTSVTDLGLTENGIRQAESLRGALDPSSFELILSSPRQRARLTAELAGFTGAYQPEISEDLVEWFYGDYEGLTSAQIQESDPGWTIFTHPTPGGETHGQVTERLDRVIDRIRDSGVERGICFSHGHALRALAVRWLGLDLMWGAHFPLDTGTLSILGEEKGSPAMLRWNAV